MVSSLLGLELADSVFGRLFGPSSLEWARLRDASAIVVMLARARIEAEG